MSGRAWSERSPHGDRVYIRHGGVQLSMGPDEAEALLRELDTAVDALRKPCRRCGRRILWWDKCDSCRL